MKKDVIVTGSEVKTINGCEVVENSDGKTVATESYYVEEDGSRTKIEDRLYTISEIEQLMRENDGRNHEVIYIAGPVLQLYEELGIEDPDISSDYNNDILSENTARNGRKVIWYMDDSKEAAIYVDNCELLTKEEIEKELS